ncbi:nitroreductase family deazaflavin-dependent oxidoreductase [Microbacterium sp. NPDC057407]|uniref:nitroreductase family deazaflavin-dependent oxidoreductase n=1 Tax=Microbacterium sp. NPDC057407 TaxID=3346120 RepID=UPI00366FF15B
MSTFSVLTSRCHHGASRAARVFADSRCHAARIHWNARSGEIASPRVNNDVNEALHRSQLIDLTTTGRRTGLPRRIEIFLHDEDGVLFITGMPRRDRTRDWIRNITADPHVIVHLKQGITADVPATARVITDPREARPLIEAAARRWRRDDVDEMIAYSPLIVLTVADAPAG